GSAGGRRAPRRPAALAYLSATLGLGILSTLIATYAGFSSGIDRDLATPIFAIYAIALLVADQRMRHWALGCGGSALVFAALVHGLAWNATAIEFLANLGWQPVRPAVVALLLHGTILAALGFVIPSALRSPGGGPTEDDER